MSSKNAISGQEDYGRGREGRGGRSREKDEEENDGQGDRKNDGGPQERGGKKGRRNTGVNEQQDEEMPSAEQARESAAGIAAGFKSVFKGGSNKLGESSSGGNSEINLERENRTGGWDTREDGGDKGRGEQEKKENAERKLKERDREKQREKEGKEKGGAEGGAAQAQQRGNASKERETGEEGKGDKERNRELSGSEVERDPHARTTTTRARG
jgi:trichohyalin